MSWRLALRLLHQFAMSDNEEQVSRKVVVEEQGSSSSRQNTPMLIGLALLVIAIVVFIFMNVR